MNLKHRHPYHSDSVEQSGELRRARLKKKAILLVRRSFDSRQGWKWMYLLW